MSNTQTQPNGGRNGAPPGQPTPAPRSMLSGVKKGRVVGPQRVLLYGVEGIGKSSFGASTPAPIFLETEDGTASMDIARFHRPREWTDVLTAIRELTLESHEYKTLVVDTVDWLEPLCWAHVCRVARKDSIEDFGFGKGYIAALDAWRVFVAALEQLRARKQMHVILLAHSQCKLFKNPEGEDYDRYSLKIHEKAAGLLKEWCDAVLFANWRTYTRKADDKKKAKGISDGTRVMFTERRAAFDAKNRAALPFEMPLDWQAFFETVLGADETKQREALRAEFEALLPRVPEETQTNVRAWLAKDPSAEDMRKWINKLQTMAQAAESAESASDQPANEPTTEPTTQPEAN